MSSPGKKYSFDIERAIATWRQFLTRERSVSEGDLKELEAHLRDEMDHVRRSGMSDEAVYRRALQSIGDYAAVGQAYREVYWDKRAKPGKICGEIQWRLGLFGSYLKLAFRTLRREQIFASINIIGLASGIAVFLFVFLFIQHERSFDQFHENADRIYRIVGPIIEIGVEQESWTWSGGPTLYDPTSDIRTSITGVQDAVRTQRCPVGRIATEREGFRDLEILCTNSNFFDIFSFELLEGQADGALSRPQTAVISRSLSSRLFGLESPIGETIPMIISEKEVSVEITGLVDDTPVNTLFSFDILLSYDSIEHRMGCRRCSYYVLLEQDSGPDAITAQVLNLLSSPEKGGMTELRLEALTDIHFSEIRAARQGDIRYIYLFSAIGLIILLIASFNYMNLATARSTGRMTEIGIRKVLGANRRQIAHQFLLETVVLTLMALPLAILVVAAFLPTFNALADTTISINWKSNWALFIALISLLAALGVIAGSYPAFYISSFKPVAALRGRLQPGLKGKGLRKSLIVFQFSCSTLLIIGTFVIISQLYFMQDVGLGFDAEQVVVVDLRESGFEKKTETVKEEFLNHVAVVSASAASGGPGQQEFTFGGGILHQPGGKPGFGPIETMIYISTPSIDVDYLETMRIPVLAGRNISSDNMDKAVAEGIINVAGLSLLGVSSPAEAIGLEIARTKIVGVVDNFYFRSLHWEIDPLVMRPDREGKYSSVALRIATSDTRAILDDLESIWKALGTGQPFAYTILTEDISKLYENEQRIARVFGLFASLTILIACLGLFGLAAFSVVQRTKEIGIRKAIGASVRSIVILLSQEFLWLVGLAFVIATPIAYVAAERWLESFAYRIQFEPVLLFGAGLLVLFIAVVSVGVISIRSASANPVESLRYE